MKKQLPLTKKQLGIYNYIKSFIEENNYAPSYREVASELGFTSVATVAEYISVLEAKGYLTKEDGNARSLQLTPSWEERAFEIPLIGIISAGKPIEAIRTNETIEIPRDMMGPNVFALKVSGDSMVEDGIFDGDYVIIEKTNHPRNGDIVVALVDNENVTLKRFFREKTRIRLQPANKSYKPIYTRRALVQGRVRGVIRKFH
ncbi:MAG: transcriptional repressor LexA [Candidatus Berkelbacteria bacterium]|nr:transcriptional repressor LexA [Candidatus Berkelbacteria bacterium]